MKKILFISDPKYKFEHSMQNGINQEDIDIIIPNDFKGKDFFSEFYLAYNGGVFVNGARFYRNLYYKIEKQKVLEIEGFYFITKKNDFNEKSPFLVSIHRIWQNVKKYSAEVEIFANTHFPFATDASGNHFWIDLQTGIVKGTLWDVGIDTENALIVAPTFYDFCRGIR